ncbi:MAG TPA: VOC family protein [Candidatus Saccharimonadia bacterium]
MLSSAPVCPTIAVKDMAVAEAFYKGKLGLKPAPAPEGVVLYESGKGTMLSLYESAENAGTNQATYATWEVADFDGTLRELRANGVEFENYDLPGLKTEDGVASWDDQKAAWFKDPDGNILCLHSTSAE